MAFFTERQLEGISAFYDELHASFSKVCKLYYNPKFETGNQNLLLSDNTYLKNIGDHGGPIQSTQQIQGGTGLIANDVTENINLIIEWNIKDSQKFASITNKPYSVIRTRGYLSDLPKIQQCREMQTNLPSVPIVSGRYKVLGEGEEIFSIIQNRFFVCYWERIS